LEQFAVSDCPLGRGDGAVVIEGGLIGAARLHMAVDCVKAGVAPRVGEPAAVDPAFGVENALRRRYPGDLARRLGPKSLRIGAPLVIGLPIAARHRFLPSPPRSPRPPRSAENCRAWRVRTQRWKRVDDWPVALPARGAGQGKSQLSQIGAESSKARPN